MILLVLALAAGTAGFLLTSEIGMQVSDHYLKHTDYLKNHDLKYVDSLQEYVTDNDLSVTDQDALNEWANQNKELLTSIYDENNQILFASDNLDSEVASVDVSAAFLEIMKKYPITFSDGAYFVSFFGVYAYRLYNTFFLVSLAVAFAVFLFIFLYGIRRKTRYISQLREEIEIMGSGDLTHPITVKGSDELTDLGANLNQLRTEFSRLIDSEAELLEENDRIVHQISHDIRTPLTSIDLYIELLKTRRYNSEDQMDQYLDKIRKAKEHLSLLTDELAQQAGRSDSIEIFELRRITYEDLVLSLHELCQELNISGFRTEEQYEPLHGELLLGEVQRTHILNNVLSNINNYADPAQPVHIISKAVSGHVQLHIQNSYSPDQSSCHGSGIGLNSIRRQLEPLGGSVRVEEDDTTYCLTLTIPLRH